MTLTITLDPGRHDRREVPLEVRLPDGAPDGGWRLEPGAIPAQAAGGRLMFVLDRMTAGKPVTLTASPHPQAARVSVTESPDLLEFAEDGAAITGYHHGPKAPRPVPSRPYFAPLLHDGVNLTREVPLKTGPAPEVDHPHHKSLYVAFGSLNGADCWDDGDHRGQIRHVAFGRLMSGPVCAGFEETLRWESKAGEPLLDETRFARIWRAASGTRCLDLSVLFRAAKGPVTFGDTKEGGICSLRVAEPMQGDAAGIIVNAHGGVGEADCWGHRSPWVDYSGPLAGKRFGMAILDHPRSFRFPTHWHVRDYGLFTANPFGWHDFQTGWSNDGSHVLEPGAVLPFHYRVVLHGGDHRAGRIAERWLDFAHPPVADVKPA